MFVNCSCFLISFQNEKGRSNQINTQKVRIRLLECSINPYPLLLCSKNLLSIHSKLCGSCAVFFLMNIQIFTCGLNRGKKI